MVLGSRFQVPVRRKRRVAARLFMTRMGLTRGLCNVRCLVFGVWCGVRCVRLGWGGPVCGVFVRCVWCGVVRCAVCSFGVV